MKKILVIALAVLLCLALCVPAFATYESVAAELAEADLIRGTGDSLELDRVPKRIEAGTMLVRLCGAEEEALADYQAGKISNPFTDVPDWGAPYVSWLYEKGLTRGISATEFGSDLPCSGHDYSVFMLRTLGYEDGVDFEYDDAPAFAENLGFYSSLLYGGEFLRGDMTAVTYQALVTDMKDGSKALVESLAESGAVTEDAAKTLMDKAALVKELETLIGKDETAIDADIKVTAKMTSDGESSSLDMNGNLKAITPDNDDILAASLAALLNISMDDESLDLDMWLKDGVIYIKVSTEVEGEPVVSQFKLDISFISDMIGEMDLDSDSLSIPGGVSLSIFDTLEKTQSGDDTNYVCTITGDTIKSLVSKLLGPDMAAILDEYDIGDIKAVYTVSGGKLTSMEESFSMVSPFLDEDGTTFEFTMDFDVLLTINALGDDVVIEFPEFTDYIDLSELLAAFSDIDLSAVAA